MTLTVIRAGDVSPAVRRRYVRHVQNAQRRIGRLEQRAVKDALADLMMARSGILAALSDATRFGQWQLPQVLRAVEEAIQDYQRRALSTAKKHTEAASALGLDRPLGAARAAGVDVTVPQFNFALPREQIDLAAQLYPEMIQAEAGEVLKRVGREIRLSFAGGQTKEALIRRIQQNITKPLRFGTLRKRAETIARTEVARIHNAAHSAGQQALAASNVAVQKQWIYSGKRPGRRREIHYRMNGLTVDVDKPFPYPGLPRELWPMYPLDPVLPAEHSINCGCTTIEVFTILDEDDDELNIGVEITESVRCPVHGHPGRIVPRWERQLIELYASVGRRA